MAGKSAVLAVTSKCNNDCIMCTNLAKFERKQPDLALPRLLDMIRGYNEEIDQVTLTGGEPTLRKEIFEILREINRRAPNAHVMVLSNGRMFYYRSFAEHFLGQGIKNLEFGIPICGHSSELHDSVTRSPGSFSQAVSGIKNLLSMGALIELRVVLHRMNYRNIKDIAVFAKKEFPGIDRIVFFGMETLGNAFENKDKLLLSYRDLGPYLEEGIDSLTGVNARLYHFPLCVLPPRLWPIAWRSLEERKIKFLESCCSCLYREHCLGIMKTYSATMGTEEFVPITKKMRIIESGNTYNPVAEVQYD